MVDTKNPLTHITTGKSNSPFFISIIFKKAPPKINGKLSKNENEEASCLEAPKNLAPVKVIPERETPGNMAKTCIRPIINDGKRAVLSLK